MQCKHCAYPDTRVVYTTHNDLGNVTQRRRECVKCGMRFTTHEEFREKKDDKKK